jgi:adenylosuccinate synthase
VLSGFDELPVCHAYRLPDGSTISDFPAHQSDFHHAAPVFETLPGWGEPIDRVTSFADLPEAARSYVEHIEQGVGVPVALVGVGRRRDQILTRPGATLASAR